MANKRIEQAIEESLLESLTGNMDEDEIKNLELRITTARKLAPSDHEEK